MKKKIIIPIVIIVILSAILCVEVLHFIQKDSSDINKNPPAGTTYINKQEASLEKGIDLSGTYSENDLEIKEETLKINGYNEDIPLVQISGLKNKKIEDKINKELKQTTNDYVNEWLKNKKGHENNIYFDSRAEANFANVLSVKISFWGDSTDDFIGLNYNLVTGEKIEFSDLFNKNESLEAIVRQIFYKSSLYYNHQNLDSIEGDPGFIGDPYYDTEKGAWYCKYGGIDPNTGKGYSEIREYVLAMDENEIEKYTKKFLNDENKQFCFSPADLTIKENNQIASIYLKDIANCVAIYDKYLTKDSIFERNDIGAKSLITCSFESNFGKLKETKYESNNFFYDIALTELFEDDFNANDFVKQKEDESISNLRKKVDEYKQIASNNSDKAYFLFLQTDLCTNKIDYYGTDEESGQWKRLYKTSSLLNSEYHEKVFVCNINEKDKLLEAILECYRYYNVDFYGSIYHYITRYDGFNDEDFDFSDYELKDYKSQPSKVENNFFDILTNEEYKTVSDIFIDDIDYKKLLKFFSNNVEINDKTTFTIERDGINLEDINNKSTRIYYGDIRPYIKIKALNESASDKENRESTLNNYKQSISNRENLVNTNNTSSDNINTISNTIGVNELTNSISNEEISAQVDEILPSSTRRLEPSEIENMTKDELYLAYNEIFARHGHDFKTKKYKDYFSQKEWYHPIEGKSVELSELNEFEVYNAKLLKNAADSK